MELEKVLRLEGLGCSMFEADWTSRACTCYLMNAFFHLRGILRIGISDEVLQLIFHRMNCHPRNVLLFRCSSTGHDLRFQNRTRNFFRDIEQL